MLTIRLSRNVIRTGINERPASFIIKNCFCLSAGSTRLSEKTQHESSKIYLFNQQRRHVSVQTHVESAIKSQSGFFQTLSESTPVHYAQDLLLSLHDTSGLPWWATIVVSTIFLRTCVTVPLAVYQQYIIAKVENLKLEMPDIVKELKMETAYAIKKFKWTEKEARIVYNRSLKKQWNNLIVRDNCHPFKATLLLFVQLPMWICLSISLRNLVYMLPVPDLQAQITLMEMSVGGIGWISNLTIADTTFILPVLLGLVNLSIIEIQLLSKVTVPGKFQKFVTNFFRGISIVMIPVAASVPSCLCLYWFTSSTYGLVQNLVLMNPRVRRFFKVPQTASELENPYKQIAAGAKFKFNNLLGRTTDT